MGYKIKRSSERGSFDNGWLKTQHSFSFGNYYDPNNMGFRHLRVINEDRVSPNHGFPPHNHQDMEIISIVLEGELAHKDSTGTVSSIKAGDVQAMSAGSGVTHSEYNPSNTNHTHFLQIWIIPDTKGILPRYQQITPSWRKNQWTLIATKEGRDGSIQIQQDVNVYLLHLEEDKVAKREARQGRYGWLQVIDGQISLDGDTLQAGDGAAINENTSIHLQAKKPSRLLFFDLN